MTLVYTINGIEYLPLRAVPAVTSGLLDPATLAHMITDPEAFWDANYDQIIAPKSLQADGRLLSVSHHGFAAFLNAPMSTNALRGGELLPAGMVVEKAAVREKFDLVAHEVGRNFPERVPPAQTVWDNAPSLNARERSVVLAGLPSPRANSVATMQANLRSAYQQVKAACEAHGMQLDLSKLPCTKAVWTTIFNRLVPGAKYRTPATLNDHYRSMGLRWRQGRDANADAAFQAAMYAAKLL